MEKKDQVMTFRVTTKERRIIEEQAKKEGSTPDAYMRSAVLMSLCMDGHPKAIALALEEMRETVVERVKAWRSAGLQGVRGA